MKPADPKMVGKRFGKWTVLGLAPKLDRRRERRWMCRCDCGTVRSVVTHTLIHGLSTQCGCVKTHGHASHKGNSPEYKAWTNMLARCRNQNHPAFKHYGARGITVDPSWEKSFEQFYADMGPRPSPKHSIERRENDGPYAAWNCYWATKSTQRCNTRRTKWFTYNGRSYTATELAQIAKVPISASAMYGRLMSGWTVERALATPVKPKP